MSYDCCGGDGRVAGESLGAALRGTLHLIHESFNELLGADSQHLSWMFVVLTVASLLLLVVLAVVNLPLVASLLVTEHYRQCTYVASKVTRSLDRNRTISPASDDYEHDLYDE
ncbi:hypothetical protein ALC60_14274 [Trachymyrmex zeteki]|uniref:Uncharacterized protein n=1 Tax=Mycetomoellerius zeteki TaxID=64791 RepID=A0A151WFZ0_9HYME|nr:hypothetical protein ALC60_14274 [Trachymyrmex zeteki]